MFLGLSSVRMSTLCLLTVISCVIFSPVLTSVIRQKEGDPEAKVHSGCPGRQPCGWLVYNKFTRITQFFMNNTCTCGSDKLCAQSDDDLSVGAYIYRCTKVNK